MEEREKEKRPLMTCFDFGPSCHQWQIVLKNVMKNVCKELQISQIWCLLIESSIVSSFKKNYSLQKILSSWEALASWKTAWSPDSIGYSVSLSKTIVKWIDIWITNSRLSSFRFTVNMESLHVLMNSVKDFDFSMATAWLFLLFLRSSVFNLFLLVYSFFTGK